MNHRLLLFPILSLALAGRAVRAQSASPSFRLQQSTLNGGGTTSISPAGTNFRLTASLGQEAVIGVSASPGYVLQSGFWSYYGSGLVPVLLTVRKNGVTPANPELSWSGNNSPYLIYRQFGTTGSSACGSVFGNFLTSQTPALYTDASPPASPLTCYNVLATAPGPTPPAGEGFSPNPAGTLDLAGPDGMTNDDRSTPINGELK